ncbi:hypothetical protein GCM10017710_02350 [Arthrobacter ramosus]
MAVLRIADEKIILGTFLGSGIAVARAGVAAKTSRAIKPRYSMNPPIDLWFRFEIETDTGRLRAKKPSQCKKAEIQCWETGISVWNRAISVWPVAHLRVNRG